MKDYLSIFHGQSKILAIFCTHSCQVKKDKSSQQSDQIQACL